MIQAKVPAGCLAACAATLLGSLATPGAPGAASSFSKDALWDDGKAELNLYDAEAPLYGEKRRFEARMIVVKEDFKKDLRVKSDDGPVPGRTLEVLKLNHLRVIPAGSYDHHEMVSAYLDREAFRPVKLTMSHFESCGITFVEVLPEGDHLAHTSHSYWDKEGDRTLQLPFGVGDLLYDALPLQIRGMDLATMQTRSYKVLPSQMSGKVRNLTLASMTLRVAGKEKVQVPAGEFEVFQVELSRPEGKDRYYFEVMFPHRLVKMETAEGGIYRLRKSLRLDYWNFQANGDEQRLK
ncbi:MAG: DUF3108 domain-containing protein [Acidobacteria bacterium]|nr:DUF3108 domain-containing protein [Acidobacteriota bacterium]